jgi:hypothetical protein
MISAILTPSSVEFLKRNFKILFAVDQLKPDQYLHHVTLAYKPNKFEESEIQLWDLDGTCKIILKEMVSNSEIENQAITVDVFNSKGEKLETDKIFHITVSTGNKPPATSNDLLKNRSTADIETINKVTLDANIQYL